MTLPGFPNATRLTMRWHDAWELALYGDNGFFRRQAPADHFRTSANSSGLFAAAIWRLIQDEQLDAVVDMGAGRGELLTELHRLSAGTLTLTGVEVAERPAGLPDAIGWQHELPQRIKGLLIANEWLDNIPCDVVEADENGVVRFVSVDTSTGEENLGEACLDPWLDQWWPLQAGERAEIGSPRDAAWADAVGRVEGIAIAIDYGHTADDRPIFGSMRSYLGGVEVDVIPDGSRDVTAHVAVDSVAAAVGATLRRQADALAALGVSGKRPPLDLASCDPAAYIRALSDAGLSSELTARGGWGDFWWMSSDTRPSVKD